MELKVQGFKRSGDLSTIFKKNLEHAKQTIESIGSFRPTLIAVTEKNILYVMLDVEFAESIKCSPNDQVEPLVRQLSEMKEKFGELEGYQVIGEAWMKIFKKESIPKIRHGDIADMAGRVELLTCVEVKKGKNRQFRNFEIIREENSERVIEYKPLETGGKWDSTKFPAIPSVKDTWTGDVGNE